jgi:hypothetical protein
VAPPLSQERNSAGFPLSLGNLRVVDWPSVVTCSIGSRVCQLNVPLRARKRGDAGFALGALVHHIACHRVAEQCGVLEDGLLPGRPGLNGWPFRCPAASAWP